MINSLSGKLLQVAAYDGITNSANLIYELSGEKLVECVFSFNEYGDLSLDVSADLSFEESLPYLLPQPVLIWRVNDGPFPIWMGRGNIPAWEDGKLKITALGLWNVLDDERYTAFWSTQLYEGWQQLNVLDEATAFPERFQFDTSNRLYITAEPGTTQGNGRIGYLGYRVPSRSRRNITNIDYTYAFDNALNWQYGVQARTETWAFTSNITNPVGTALPTPLTGTSALTTAGTPAIALFYRFMGADTVYSATSGNAGTQYIQLSAVRLRSTNTIVNTQFIAADILAAARARNPNFLSARQDKIGGTTSFDHKEAVFEDAQPTEVLKTLAARAATGTPPVPLNIGVWEGVFVVQNRYAGARTWYHDLLDIKTRRDILNTVPAAYATYTDATGRTIRTAEAQDTRAIARTGINRVEIVQTDTTDATQAATQRDLYLADRKRGAIQFSIPETSVIYDANGSPVPITEVRPGDLLVAQQFQTYDANDPLRQIRIGTVTIDAIRGMLQMEAEEPIPTLETTLAGQS